jgi:hypothetical protein
MTSKWHLWLMPACLLASLATGCGSPARFSVETVVHPDGSCDRTTWQPKDEFLPDEALKPEWIAALRHPEQPPGPDLPKEALRPEWIARWKSVVDASGPPGLSPSGASAGRNKYFGSWANIGESSPLTFANRRISFMRQDFPFPRRFGDGFSDPGSHE